MAAVNFKDIEPDIEAIQSEFKKLINDKELCRILGDEFSGKLREWDSAITRKRCEPFSLVVLGDFKRGKSTVINAILGKSITPVNVAPETFTINSIGYAEKPSAEAVLKNGNRIKLEPEDLKRERLENLMRAFPHKLDYIEIKDNIDILKEIRIVDTPGLSDLDLLDKQVQDYLVNADAIVFVASALSPFSESEQMFLASYVRPLNFNKLYVLVNMIDAMNSQEDIDKILNRISERCGDVMPNAYIYGISGIDEYRRKIGLNRPDIKGFQEFYESQFLKFEVSLRSEIITQKDSLRVQRVITMLYLMIMDASTRIRMIYEMIALDKQNLDDLSAGIENKCSALQSALNGQKPAISLSVTEMQQEGEQWMYGFFSKLREDILGSRNTASPEDIEKHFYSYLIDKVGEAYRKCIDIHRKEINALVTQTGRSVMRKLGLKKADIEAASADSSGKFNMLVTNYVMGGASGDGNDSAFPAGTMPFFRNILKKKRQSDAIDATLENYDDIRSNTIKDLKTAYKFIEENSLKQFDNIYNTHADASREAVGQAMEMTKVTRSENIRPVLENAAGVLNGAAAILKKYY